MRGPVIRRRKPIARSVVPIGRTALKRSGKRIAQRSERALAKLPERARVVDAAWERDRGQCQAKGLVPERRCGGKLDPHEIIPRSAWPDGELVLDNVLMVCREHHEWIGDNPAAAHDRGLHRFSWERPARCEECGAPWIDLVGDRCPRCGNRTWERPT